MKTTNERLFYMGVLSELAALRVKGEKLLSSPCNVTHVVNDYCIEYEHVLCACLSSFNSVQPKLFRNKILIFQLVNSIIAQ